MFELFLRGLRGICFVTNFSPLYKKTYEQCNNQKPMLFEICLNHKYNIYLREQKQKPRLKLDLCTEVSLNW